MVRRTRPPLPVDAASTDRPSLRRLNKEEFAQRLNAMMLRRGWNQADLARASAFPTPQSLESLASAFGIPPHELLPNHMETAMDYTPASFEMKAVAGVDGIVWLRINRAVTMTTAVQITTLLEAGDDRRGRSSGIHG